MKQERCFLVARTACALSLFAAALATAAPTVIDSEHYERTQARDDLDAGLVLSAAEACVSGRGTIAAPNPATACATAYEHAINIGSFDTALRFAAIGCEMWATAPATRALPLRAASADPSSSDLRR